jgi:hypothetical protein
MKVTKLFIAISLIVLTFTSCETKNDKTTVFIDFEDVQLGSNGYFNGSTKLGDLINGSYQNVFQSGVAQFLNVYTPSEYGDYWGGFACSSKTDSVTPGYANQYSVVAGTGALNSAKFALAYDTSYIHIPYVMSNYEIKSIMLTNSTYTYLEMKNGGFGKKFTTGDWFKVIIKGYYDTTETGTVEFYLADFRDGKNLLLKEWKKVDVSKLGKVNKIRFTFDSSDKGTYGINTPKYVCVDNIELLSQSTGGGLTN